jgi:hypothetical protein
MIQGGVFCQKLNRANNASSTNRIKGLLRVRTKELKNQIRYYRYFVVWEVVDAGVDAAVCFVDKHSNKNTTRFQLLVRLFYFLR